MTVQAPSARGAANSRVGALSRVATTVGVPPKCNQRVANLASVLASLVSCLVVSCCPHPSDSCVGRLQRAAATSSSSAAASTLLLLQLLPTPVYSHSKAPSSHPCRCYYCSCQRQILLFNSPPRCDATTAIVLYSTNSSLTAHGWLPADDRFPERRHNEEVRDGEERLGDAVKVVHVGEDLVVLRLGCNVM